MGRITTPRSTMVRHRMANRPHLLHMHTPTIHGLHHRPKQTPHLTRIQRLSTRTRPLLTRLLPKSKRNTTTRRHKPRNTIRQLHRHPRRSKRTTMGKPTNTTRSHPHPKRLTMLQLRQTRRSIRNNPHHRIQRPHLQYATTNTTIPDEQQHTNQPAE